MRISLFTVALASLALASVGEAQSSSRDSLDAARSRADSIAARRLLPPVVVTATRTPKTTFESPVAVSFVDTATIRRSMPNSVADLFRDLAGVDVTGVGTNQVRPSIRGQRGQRILLLEDGIRLNNSRRQQDFGELPSLVATSDVERVEVVRGPASVLYGTDAIGGVLNVITSGAPELADARLHGSAAIQHGTADGQRRTSLALMQRLGKFSYRASGTLRSTSAYDAPSGTFGKVTLASEQRVHDTGVDDDSWSALLGYDITANQRLTARVERYTARDAGFGYVEPSVIGPTEPLIRIVYPDQAVARYSLRYEATSLSSMLADRVSVVGYGMDNARHLAMNIFIPFGPGTPAGAGVQSNSANFTDIATLGMRAEASKSFARHQLTYGVDAFRDRSDNTDSSVTTVIGFGPPRPDVSTAAQVPNASFRSGGVFAQSDIRLSDRVGLIVGARGQQVEARTRPPTVAPIVSRDRTLVGTASSVVRVAEGLNVIASVGRGFRSPNLVERFFDGPTPEGSGYEKSSPDLRAETSLNVDLGVRLRRGILSLEAFTFRNDVRDGVRIAATGDSVGRMPVFKNLNVDRLRFSGTELESSAQLGALFALRGSWTRLRSRNVLDPNNPVGTSYSSKTIGELAYRDPAGRASLSYLVRRNGRQTDQQIGTNPIGTELPPFTVQTVRGSLGLFDRMGVRGTLFVAVENLGNTLYAETSNATFFRTQPGRNFMATWALDF